jgi:selenocysteine-specific elongation factor
MRSLVIGTAGHIDHGKSALVRALTGIDPDRLKEEKARGITIDLGFAHARIGDCDVAFVDVPGHERFVKNMLAGVGGIDAVLLVVAADESVMPQTREHFAICRLLHIQCGVVALTKIDLADPDMIEIARLEVRELLAGTPLERAPILPVSSKTGEGVPGLQQALANLAAAVRERPIDGAPRLPIDRVFSMRGFGTVVTGTLTAGSIAADQELILMPGERPVKIRGIQVHGHDAAEAVAGNRVAVNLGGVEVAELARGDTLCAPGAFEPSRRIDVAIDLLEGARPLRHGARVRFHQGTTELLGRVAIAGHVAAAGPALEIAPGRSAYARIRLEAPAVLTRGDRFILRSYSPSITVAGGVVLDPHPTRSGIRSASAQARFRHLDPKRSPGQAVDNAVSAFISERAAAGLPRAALVSRAGLSRTEAEAAAGRLIDAGRAVAVADLLVCPSVIADLAARLIDALRAHHGSQPLSEGLPREEARERLFGRAAPAVFEFVLAELTRERKIVARDRLALAGHQVSLTAEESHAHAAIERLFREANLAPPDASTIAAAAHVPGAIADRMTALLLRQKKLVKLDSLLFHADALAQLKNDVRGLAGKARVDVPAFKERYGITRKFAIPLLEYLDRERVTRRVGDSRIVL